MRLLHISDTHGKFLPLNGKFNAVIHTGDFFPDFPELFVGNKTGSMLKQEIWLESQALTMKEWLDGHPFLFVLGNHDFMSPKRMEDLLSAHGINAINLHDKIVSFENINFYGFPYVPYINGMFNYELDDQDMRDKANEMIDEIDSTYVDIIAAHAPLYGKLDVYHGHLGSLHLGDAIDYRLSRDMMPSYYLHGHIHESYGISVRNGLIISNAARTQHIIEI